MIAIVLGIPIGVISAIKQYTLIDNISMMGLNGFDLYAWFLVWANVDVDFCIKTWMVSGSWIKIPQFISCCLALRWLVILCTDCPYDTFSNA